MKDLVYFIGSCLNEEECEQYSDELVDYYFSVLKNVLAAKNNKINADELEKEWRELFYFAWADFHRFIKGWSPGHWKINSYSEKITRKVLDSF